MLAVPKELINVLDVKDGEWILIGKTTKKQRKIYNKFIKEAQKEKEILLDKHSD
ncbi:hypothetical protein FC35_GL000511 [Limosilactobacillus coleohominis DSM 14060]|nr:hypothetical protein FC35_GL000511 [Limosilactobacillus coleohominis DSM 14060]